MSSSQIMTFQSTTEAAEAFEAVGITPDQEPSGDWRGTVNVPDDLAGLESVLLDEEAPEPAKILAGTLVALAPDRAVDGAFVFTIRIAED